MFGCFFVYMDLSSGFLKMIISRPVVNDDNGEEKKLLKVHFNHSQCIDTNTFAIQFNNINSYKLRFLLFKVAQSNI